jgi:hypothetical protein
MDLLTVVMHELGHVLNLDSVYGGDPSDLMAAYLATGERRLPSATDQSALAVAAGQAGLGQTSQAGNLPASLVGAPGTAWLSSGGDSGVPAAGTSGAGFSGWTIPDWWFLSEGLGHTKQQPWDSDAFAFTV